MTNDCWEYQKSRLKDRFGERNFSKEFCLLVAVECKAVPDRDFVDIVNRMIGSRIPTRPPLLVDFREARLGKEKHRFDHGAHDASAGAPATPLDCSFCLDSSVVTVKHNESGKEYFMHCDCPEADISHNLRPKWRLPRWTEFYKTKFTFVPFDTKYWKPKGFSPQNIERSLQSKAEEWKLKIKISEAFFKHGGGN